MLQGLKKLLAITTAINFDPNFNLNFNLNLESDSDPESAATILSINSMPVPVEYADYTKIFVEKEILQLRPHHSGVDHKITLTPGSKLFYSSIYNLSETELRYLKEYIDRMLVRGFIHLSKSPFGSPILFIKKADGSLQLIVDYRKLNEMTVKNRYLLLLISELIDCIKNAKYYTKFDLRDAFN